MDIIFQLKINADVMYCYTCIFKFTVDNSLHTNSREQLVCTCYFYESLWPAFNFKIMINTRWIRYRPIILRHMLQIMSFLHPFKS